jgi:hypothetical protein
MASERTYEQQVRDGTVIVLDPKDGTTMMGFVTAMGPYYLLQDGTPTTDARTELHIVLPGVPWDIVNKQPIWPPSGGDV